MRNLKQISIAALLLVSGTVFGMKQGIEKKERKKWPIYTITIPKNNSFLKDKLEAIAKNPFKDNEWLRNERDNHIFLDRLKIEIITGKDTDSTVFMTVHCYNMPHFGYYDNCYYPLCIPFINIVEKICRLGKKLSLTIISNGSKPNLLITKTRRPEQTTLYENKIYNHILALEEKSKDGFLTELKYQFKFNHLVKHSYMLINNDFFDDFLLKLKNLKHLVIEPYYHEKEYPSMGGILINRNMSLEKRVKQLKDKGVKVELIKPKQ
jgi:hypothetical protein